MQMRTFASRVPSCEPNERLCVLTYAFLMCVCVCERVCVRERERECVCVCV